MNASTVIGPSDAIRSRSARSSGVAVRSKRIAGRVIICVAGFHERLDGDRSFGCDPLAKRPLERGRRYAPSALTQSLSKSERPHFDKLKVSASIHATDAVPAVDST